MHRLIRLQILINIAVKRLWAQKGLTAALILGLSMAIALLMVVPLYADAINFFLLETRLSQVENGRDRPPFSYLFWYQGDAYGVTEWDVVAPTHLFIDETAETTLGIPAEHLVYYVQTDAFRVFPDHGDELADSITSVRYAWLSDFQNHVDIVDGSWPETAESGPLQVLVATEFAAEHQLLVGETYRTVDPRSPAGNRSQIWVEIAGLWEPQDPNADYWYANQETLTFFFFVTEQSFRNQLAPVLSDEVYAAAWYLVMDGSQIGTEDVDHLIAGEQQLLETFNNFLPGVRSVISLEEELTVYRQEVDLLTTRLVVYNIPSIVLILAFIWLVIGLSVERQRNEIAVTVSRGGSVWQILGMSSIQALVVSAVAFALAIVLSLLFTQTMGQVRTFLDFSAPSNLRVSLTPTAWAVGLWACGLAILAQIGPTLSASRHTIVTFKHDQARTVRPPWWQRVGLDLILIAAVGIGYWQLSQNGQLVSFESDFQTSDVFQNPLFLLFPSLITFAATLFFLRLFPWLLRLLGYFLEGTQNVSLLQALRYLSRIPGQYASPLVLLTLTLSLSFFTASLARTLDLQLFDQEFYATGADVALETNYFYLLQGGGRSEFYLPPAAYEEIEGVDRAARIGRFKATVDLGGERTAGEFMGIDWHTFGQVAYWRSDFSAYRLGSLMNSLGLHPDGVLVSKTVLEQTELEIGEFIPITVDADGELIDLDLQIVGTFDYFPSWYESETGPLFVANLEHLFEAAGGEIVFQLWLDTNESFNTDALQREFALRRLNTTTWTLPDEAIDVALQEPARQGIFGLLSVGFISAAVLTVLGYFLYAFFSMRRRTIEIGILQAVGLSSNRMMGLIAWEMGLLIGIGTVLGSALGVTISQLFIPAIQIGAALTENTPPYLVEISWSAVYQIYALFLLLFIAALFILSVVLSRLKLFQAIKLGETV